jgi:hypothetical protein
MAPCSAESLSADHQYSIRGTLVALLGGLESLESLEWHYNWPDVFAAVQLEAHDWWDCVLLMTPIQHPYDQVAYLTCALFPSLVE